MKVLLLSCFTGEGHNSAARAIMTELTRRGIAHQMKDPTSFHGPRAERFVSSCYNGMIRHVPRAFGVIYRLGDWYDRTGLPSPIYHANATYAGALYDFIRQEGFDRVICTHLYGMEAMTAIRQQLGGRIATYGVLTDYTPIPFLCETVLDGYCIPHEALREAMIARGAPADRLYATGIPVDPSFAQPISRQEARDRLHLPKDPSIFLVMSGGIGGGDVAGLCRQLLQAGSAKIAVLTGHNQVLRQKLSVLDPRILAIPFTREVALYMKAADVLLSKPGGLSSTEAVTAQVPLVHVGAIPGCETANVKFFSRMGMSLAARNAEQAATLAQYLLDTPQAAAQMRQCQAAMPRNAASQIVDLVTSCG